MKNRISWLLALVVCCGSVRAAVLPPQKLLPKDTLFLVTLPEGAKSWSALMEMPMARFWFDPAMKDFRDKFGEKLNSQFITPLDRDFGLKLSDYKDVIQGQATFAVVPVNQPDKPDQLFARVLLIDAKDHADQLKKNLAAIKKKWSESDKPMKTQRIREIDFTTFMTTSDAMPWKGLVPAPKNLLSDDQGQPEAKAPGEKLELTVGQDDSLLLVSDSTQAIEKILGRQEGSMIPALEDQPAYQKDYSARLQGARVYAWANVKGMLDYWLKKPPGAANDGSGGDPSGITSMLTSVGLGNLTSGSFACREGSDGTTLQFFVGAPEDNRRGLLKALAFEPKDSSPPSFVPADVVKFSRVRLDLPKSWAVLEAMIGEINPMASRTLNFILQTAGKDKDEHYDLKAELLANLGNDIISYQRSPRENTLTSLKSPPAIYLIGSPSAEKLAVAIKVAMSTLVQGSSNIKDREFLGRKIYSLATPGSQGQPGNSGFNFAASGDYLAFSSDVDMLEEYLRSGENHHMSLAETPGLGDAAQKVGGMSTGLFGYSNEKDNMRSVVETFKKGSVTLPDLIGAPIPGKASPPDDGKKLKDWADFSLLPPFDMISKYFYFSVYAGSFTPEGFSATFFMPTPPQLR